MKYSKEKAEKELEWFVCVCNRRGVNLHLINKVLHEEIDQIVLVDTIVVVTFLNFSETRRLLDLCTVKCNCELFRES